MACEEIENLDVLDHQSLVDLLFKVQLGHVSCRRAATEMLKQTELLQIKLDIANKTLEEMHHRYTEP